MPVTPAPLTKSQRRTANDAKRLHARVVRLTGELAQARKLRDEKISELVTDGVRPFVITNEVGVDRKIAEELGRKLKAAKAKRPATKKAAR